MAEFDEGTAPHKDVVVDYNERQLRHLGNDPRCRAMQLPEGLLLRYTLATTLYFYLRSGVKDGNIATRVYASDSPYDRTKADIGEVLTPMFAPQADQVHLDNVNKLLQTWVRFVRDQGEADQEFTAFEVNVRPRE